MSLSPSLPAMIRVIDITSPGGPEVLVLGERPMPVPAAGQVLIRVQAAGVNRPDVAQRRGGYPPPAGASDIPGLEVSGEIVAVGEGTARTVGERVMALVTGGGYAAYCVAEAELALPVPAGLSMIEAAAVPETYFTVWSNVFQRGALKKDETLLVHGGTSGIGTTAIQLAKAFGAQVFVTAGTEEKCAFSRELGADHAINHRQEDFVAVIREKTQGRGVDVILDMVGGSYIGRNYQAAAMDGRIVQIAFLEGEKAEVDFRRLMLKRLTHTGSTLRSRPVHEKAAIAADLRTHVWPLLEQGRCKPVIGKTLPLEQAAEAHALMESGSLIGKIVLEL